MQLKRTSDLEDQIKVFFREYRTKSQRKKEIIRKKYIEDFEEKKNLFNRNYRMSWIE